MQASGGGSAIGKQANRAEHGLPYARQIFARASLPTAASGRQHEHVRVRIKAFVSIVQRLLAVRAVFPRWPRYDAGLEVLFAWKSRFRPPPRALELRLTCRSWGAILCTAQTRNFTSTHGLHRLARAGCGLPICTQHNPTREGRALVQLHQQLLLLYTQNRRLSSSRGKKLGSLIGSPARVYNTRRMVLFSLPRPRVLLSCPRRFLVFSSKRHQSCRFERYRLV